jgi:hypothetical protein
MDYFTFTEEEFKQSPVYSLRNIIPLNNLVVKIYSNHKDFCNTHNIELNDFYNNMRLFPNDILGFIKFGFYVSKKYNISLNNY